MTELTLFGFGFALIAGLISFLSPCILPIVPGFLAYLAGTSLQEAKKNRWQIFIASVFFVLGFTAVFSALGVLLNTALEAISFDVQRWVARAGGVIIIIFGLYLTGVLKIPFLDREYKLKVKKGERSKYATSFLFGAAFAAGWTPCVGAVLGGILALAAVQPGSAFILLVAYSIGLGIPFLLVGLFASRATVLIQKLSKWFTWIKILFGLFLIAIGILAFTQNLARIANIEFISNLLPL